MTNRARALSSCRPDMAFPPGPGRRGAMQVTNCGRGVHTREVKGVERLKALPSDWYAFTNLELATGIGRSRELDVIMVTDHMIFLVDLKDWSGTIESDSGNWLHNGRDTGPSPVAKIHS